MCELSIRGRYENESNPRMQLIEPKWLIENLKKFRWESHLNFAMTGRNTLPTWADQATWRAGHLL